MFPRRIYLLDISRRVPKPHVFNELVDILASYRYNELFLYEDKGESASAADPSPLPSTFFPKLASYCQMQDIALTRLGKDEWERFYLSGECVAVATESANSLAGRVEEMRERMERAEEMARTRGAKAFVVTDFADGFAWQPLAASLPGIVMGGSFASAGHKSAKMDLERELNGVLGVPLGGILLKLGTLYLRGGARRDDSSEYFNILAHDHGYSRHPGITQAVLDDVSGIAHGVKIAAERWTDRSDWAREIAYMAMLLDAACHRRDEARLRALRDEHGRVWRMRFLEDGRVESLARLPRF